MLPHDGGAGGGRGRCTCLPAAVVPRRAGPAGLRPGCFMRGPRGLKKPYTACSDAQPLRPGPANRPVSGRHTGRSAAQYGPFRSLLRPVSQSVTARLPMRCGPGRCASEAASWIIFTKNECPHSAKCCGFEGIGRSGLLVVMSCRSLHSSAESSGVACKSCSQPTPG